MSAVLRARRLIAMQTSQVQIPVCLSSGLPFKTSHALCKSLQHSLVLTNCFSRQISIKSPCQLSLFILILILQSPNDEARDRFLNSIDKALKPYIADNGYDWEYSIEETRRDLWKIQGLVPPMPRSEAELEWVKNNRATEFELEKGNL